MSIQPERLRDAREYLGFRPEQVAQATGWPADLLAAFEAGTQAPSGDELAVLANLYRRPLEWFSGQFRYEPDPAFLAMVERVPIEGDRVALLEFGEFLAGAGKPATTTTNGGNQ